MLCNYPTGHKSKLTAQEIRLEVIREGKGKKEAIVFSSKEFPFGMIRKLIEMIIAQHHEYSHYQLITY